MSISNTKSYLIILGGGVMQIPLIKTARDKKYHVIVLDGNPKATGNQLCDTFLVVDISKYYLCLNAILKWIEKKRQGDPFFQIGYIQGILTVGTDFTVTVSFLAKSLGLPSIPIHIAKIASHKGLMRQYFSQYNIKQPSFILFKNSNIELNSIKQQFKNNTLDYPVIVKPVDNMGARGVNRVFNDKLLKEAIQNAFKYSKIQSILIENCLWGHEFSIDAFIHNKKIYITGIADRLIKKKDSYCIEEGHIIPSQRPLKEQYSAISVFRKAILALGIENGFAKGDILYEEKTNQSYVIEIAARLSGGYMSSYTYPLATGVNLMEKAIDLVTEKKPKFDIPLKGDVAIERAIIAPKIGVLKKVKGLKKIHLNAGYHSHYLNCSKGDNVAPPRNNVEKIGSFIVSGKNYEEALKNSHNILQKLKVIID